MRICFLQTKFKIKLTFSPEKFKVRKALFQTLIKFNMTILVDVVNEIFFYIVRRI